jgi:protein MpaA
LSVYRSIIHRLAVALTAAFAASSCGGQRVEPTHTRNAVDRPAQAPTVRTTVIGRSVAGRPIRLTELGRTGARPVVLVVGCIHGDECAGSAVARLLRTGAAPQRGRLLVVDNLNPDGHARGTRVNAHGVDLNRNFPGQWRPRGVPFDPQYSGPRPSSEPETRIAERLIRRERPDVTLWFHQPQHLVRAWGHSAPMARHYARLAGAPFRRLHWLTGTAPNWQNHAFPRSASFVIELAARELGARAAARYASAAHALLGG